jgi:uncharacterized membrane protein YczE
MGIAVTLLKRSQLGLSPWDVFHDGVARHLGVDLGIVSIVAGVPLLLLWWPLRQWPGVGTFLNVILVGAVVHRLLPHLGAAHGVVAHALFTVAGLGLFALGQGLYLSTELGPGPRDGLMTGLNRRFGWSIRLVRTGIETAALLVGIALGGSFGIGTIVFALAIGPMVQVTLGWFGYQARLVDVLGLSGE